MWLRNQHIWVKLAVAVIVEVHNSPHKWMFGVVWLPNLAFVVNLYWYHN